MTPPTFTLRPPRRREVLMNHRRVRAAGRARALEAELHLLVPDLDVLGDEAAAGAGADGHEAAAAGRVPTLHARGRAALLSHSPELFSSVVALSQPGATVLEKHRSAPQGAQ
ncbi:hypothetical protein WMF04_32955 [Sorangium sp. So ce260]|uniref:hypothetical protein n=1 Tax=Sorangium sp. So ce260 TaxID=3133291 RepID=UPI003F5F5FF7